AMAAPEPRPPSDEAAAHGFLWAAWHRGIQAATGREPTYDDRQRGHLDRLARAFAKSPEGKCLELSERESWVEKTAVAFVEATKTKPQFWSGWTPEAGARWLNMGRPADTQTTPVSQMRQPMAPLRSAPAPRSVTPRKSAVQRDWERMMAEERAEELAAEQAAERAARAAS
ncbi:MAG: hypothetical protein ACRDQZ_09695, partial [Mycobacteriales bacterium]